MFTAYKLLESNVMIKKAGELKAKPILTNDKIDIGKQTLGNKNTHMYPRAYICRRGSTHFS